jgi:hypothetical protein
MVGNWTPLAGGYDIQSGITERKSKIWHRLELKNCVTAERQIYVIAQGQVPISRKINHYQLHTGTNFMHANCTAYHVQLESSCR